MNLLSLFFVLVTGSAASGLKNEVCTLHWNGTLHKHIMFTGLTGLREQELDGYFYKISYVRYRDKDIRKGVADFPAFINSYLKFEVLSAEITVIQVRMRDLTLSKSTWKLQVALTARSGNSEHQEISTENLLGFCVISNYQPTF